MDTDDLDVEVLVPVPYSVMRGLHGRLRAARGAHPWPDDLEAAFADLDPRPTCVAYAPIPRRSIESAAASLAMRFVKLSIAVRPRVIFGTDLEEGGYAAAVIGHVTGCPSVVHAGPGCIEALEGGGVRRRDRAREALAKANLVLASTSAVAEALAAHGVRAEPAEDLPVVARRFL